MTTNANQPHTRPDTLLLSMLSDSDFNAEVVVSSLIEQGHAPSRIRIIRDGMARRAVSKDVEQVYQQYHTDQLADYLHVHVNRESLYDMLPEGLFHQPLRRRMNPDKEDVIEEIKVHRQEEFFTRRFFHLYEHTIDQTLVDIQRSENCFDDKLTSNVFYQLFIPYWSVLKLLEHRQAVVFMYLIPLLNEIRINLSEIEESLSLILDVPVRIQKEKMPAKEADNCFESVLGEFRLGVDMVLGHTFDDGLYDLKITLGSISAHRMRGFLKTAHEYQILEMLCDIFLPDDRFSEVDFEIDPEDSAFILSDENHDSYLGINTFI